MAAGLRLSIASNWVLVEPRPDVVPLVATVCTATETVLARSTSRTVRLPDAERAASVSVRAAVLLLPVCTVIAGASLPPVRVTVTS